MNKLSFHLSDKNVQRQTRIKSQAFFPLVPSITRDKTSSRSRKRKGFKAISRLLREREKSLQSFWCTKNVGFKIGQNFFRLKVLGKKVICVKFDLALRLSRMAFLSTQLLLDHADACSLPFVSVNA